MVKERVVRGEGEKGEGSKGGRGAEEQGAW